MQHNLDIVKPIILLLWAWKISLLTPPMKCTTQPGSTSLTYNVATCGKTDSWHVFFGEFYAWCQFMRKMIIQSMIQAAQKKKKRVLQKHVGVKPITFGRVLIKF